jgi:zinc transporter ZupT
MQGRRLHRMWIRLLLVVVGSSSVLPTIASAHIPSTGAIVGLRFSVVVVASAVIGALGGIAVIAFHARRLHEWLTDRRFAQALGIGLCGLAVVILLPLASSRPFLSGGSVILGGVGAVLLPGHTADHANPLTATSAAGALTAHQFIEGVLLAAAYLAGGVVGVIAAVVLTLHTIAETAAVGGAYVLVGRHRRGVAAVVVMQAVYVGAAGIAFMSTQSISPLAEHVITALVAGVLLVVGIHECRCSTRGVIA